VRQKRQGWDVVVAGAGVAGLSAALAAADAGASVLVLAKASHRSSNSYAAQGGVAAAVGPGDDPALHAADTLAAGRGLCRPSAVRLLTEEAPARIAELRRLGVAFDDGLGREGGHSRARVVHAGGADTGRHIADVLTKRAREHRRIRLVEGERITTLGAFRGSAVVLATGGYAALWARTTNPQGAVGDGLLLGQAAGAALADLEFVQFHPTALRDENGHDGFLLSEALRGAGATLLDDGGERFVDELAPRDVVARAVAAHAGARLDLRPVERDRYPSLMATLTEAGYDPADEPVPVSPAAHYAIGGIVSDLDGRTSVPGLFAAGECACTGVHGANRLASNSLLECLVFGRRAGLAALDAPRFDADASPLAPAADPGQALWRDAGLIRSAKGLGRLLDSPHPLVRDVAACGLAREESRGVHFREDFPVESEALAGHLVVRPGSEPVREPWS
jgi:L-aspartate oxidase